MGIRPAVVKDAIAITRLLKRLGYPGTGVLLINKFRAIELKLIDQIAIAADIGRVSYSLSMRLFAIWALEM